MAALQTYLQQLHDFIEIYQINLLNWIFIIFIVTIVAFGSLVNLVESYLPKCIRQSYRYGKHSYKGEADPIVSLLEVPKSWFAHFYIFAGSWALFALYLLLRAVLFKEAAPEYLLQFLDIMAGGRTNRQVQIDSTHAVLAMLLMTMQCVRRFVETNFLQIFSKQSKINLSHYIVGYVHYFATILALLANTQGFVRDSLPTDFAMSQVTLLQNLSIFLFLYCWISQYKTNMVFVNLRKDARSGKIITEGHLLPRGHFFEFITSPHMFFEVGMYCLLIPLLPQSNTWLLVAFWVFTNQLMNALLTHKWYKENFKNYPSQRRALIPFVL